MQKNKLLIIGFVLALCVSCQVAKDADDIATVQGGRCGLTKNFSGEIMCFDFITGYSSNQGSTDCDNFKTRYAGDGVNGISFLSGDANACTTSGVGSCTISSGVMYYFSNYWNSGSAQTDCTSLGGTWAP